MKELKVLIDQHNHKHGERHRMAYDLLANQLGENGQDPESIITEINDFQVAIPSWALGTGGTRFGRFSGTGEPGTLEEKIKDVGLIHALNRSSGAISLHIPWDIPDNADYIKELAKSHGIRFDAVNSNTFQDQKEQAVSYKYGSLAHTDPRVRKHAVDHNIEVIRYGEMLGSDSLTVWLADGSCFPGQQNFRKAFQRTLASLEEIYAALPAHWRMFVEYKPFEPNFYSTVIQDWGSSLLLASKLGPKALTLVDLGHHLPNANIEQIVALLLMEGKLGGFHFNDSKYADDDLTVGSIKPYQLFLIFIELVSGMKKNNQTNQSLSWMIDASHNVKDPLEDLIQSVEAILIAYVQALLVDRAALVQAQEENDVVMAQEILQQAFRTNVQPLLAQARLQKGGALKPIAFFRENNIREQLVAERGELTIATGL